MLWISRQRMYEKPREEPHIFAEESAEAMGNKQNGSLALYNRYALIFHYAAAVNCLTVFVVSRRSANFDTRSCA